MIPTKLDYRNQGIVYIGRLQKRTQKLVKNLVVLFGIINVGYIFLNLDFSRWNYFFSTPVFLTSTLIFVSLFFLWKLFSNQLIFQFEIIPNIIPLRQVKREKSTRNQRASTVFCFASDILVVSFVLLQLIYVYMAWTNPTHSVIILYDNFGEHLFETILFTGVAVIFFFGLYLKYKGFRKRMRNV